ncbi:unnamed protein product, partial [Ectocarpus sp. 12 AP-2014]
PLVGATTSVAKATVLCVITPQGFELIIFVASSATLHQHVAPWCSAICRGVCSPPQVLLRATPIVRSNRRHPKERERHASTHTNNGNDDINQNEAAPFRTSLRPWSSRFRRIEQRSPRGCSPNSA